MSRYKAYPEYKDSGVEWLGKIPANWVTTRLKRVVSKLESGVSVNASDIPAQEGEIGVLKTSCVYTRSFRSSENKTVFSEEVNRVRCPVRKGAIIISRMNTPDLVGASALVESDAENLYLPDRLWQTVSLSLIPEFVASFMMIDGFRTQISLAAEGASSSMQNIAKDDYLAIHITHPASRHEQEKIAAFLDHETAKIDALIEKQQRLIELLKEKRQAVISHAVTKGLNPKAPMKDSGVEWLGEVPAHWVVCRLKQAIKSGSSISYGIVQPGEPLDDGIPFVQTTNMSKGTFDIDDLQKTTEEIANSYPRSKLVGGEVILGIRASIGAAFVVPEKLKGANLSRGVARIIPNENLRSEYLVLFFGTGSVSRYWDLSKQGSTFSEVSIETVREISLLIPPKFEQVEIDSFVKIKLSKIDGILDKAERKTALLKERRTALISAAVTGKIDVRDWQAAA